jgi:hypothetical protein
VVGVCVRHQELKSRAETREALLFILVEKIYPRKPILMRNDTLAASLVVQYVSIMISEFLSSQGLNQNRTRFQEEARSAYYQIFPLENLQEETIRKYIAELWRSEAFSNYLEFKNVKTYEA